MGSHRVTYVLLLAASLALHALYPFWFSWYLFIVILLILPFDLLLSIAGMVTRSISFIAADLLEKGGEGTLTIVTHQRKPFPAGCVKVKLLITFDGSTAWRRLNCGAADGSRHELAIDTMHSGVTVYEAKRIRTTSLAGLFSLSSAVNKRAAVLILPAPVKPPHIVSLPRGVILRPKPGGGFSEDNDLRSYRTGDPIRTIHWKLSAKHDSLIVREPLAPPTGSRLVHIMEWSGARERDIILGRLRWISEYLLKWELSYCVKLGEDGPVAEITNRLDFVKYLFHTLGGEERMIKAPASLPARFSWVFRVDAREEPETPEEAQE